MGEPKQLVRLGEENLLERAVRVAREAGCSPVVVVVGAEYLPTDEPLLTTLMWSSPAVPLTVTVSATPSP